MFLIMRFFFYNNQTCKLEFLWLPLHSNIKTTLLPSDLIQLKSEMPSFKILYQVTIKKNFNSNLAKCLVDLRFFHWLVSTQSQVFFFLFTIIICIYINSDTFLKPMSSAYSLKHLRHMFKPYFLMRPCVFLHTRLQ